MTDVVHDLKDKARDINDFLRDVIFEKEKAGKNLVPFKAYVKVRPKDNSEYIEISGTNNDRYYNWIYSAEKSIEAILSDVVEHVTKVA